MRRFAALMVAVLLGSAVAATQAAATGVSVSQAGGVDFPQRAFLLTIPSRGVVTPNQISVTEAGAPVQGLTIEPASTIGQSHFGTVLVVDTSDSMSGSAEQSAMQAMRTFIQTRNPKQPVGIIFFDQTARVVVPMTTDNATLESALANIPTLHSGTHIYDAVAAATKLLSTANLTGGSIILASDGRDTGSHASESSVVQNAKSLGVRVYTVGVQDSSFDGTTLQSLASMADGVYTPVSSSSLVSLYRNLGVALSNQYLIRYESRASLGSQVPVSIHVAGHGAVNTTYVAPSLPTALPSGPPRASTGSSFWSSTQAAVIVSIICALLFGLALMALLSQRAGVRSRIDPFVGLLSQPPIEDRPKSLVQRALGDPRGRRVEKSAWSQRVAEDLDIGRVQISFQRLVLLTILGMLVLGYLLVSLEGPLAGLIALAVPFVVRLGVKNRANRQRREFGEQLPDNLAVVASALRAGNTFVGSLGVVTNDAPEPSKREIRRALADEQLGVPLVDALNRISDRMQSTDFHHVALVATLQAETGGNTAEVLDVVTETIRERLELRRLVRTLTAQGRLAGWVLSALPAALLLFLSFINPSYISPLFHTTLGIIAFAAGVIMVITGSIVIRRIVDIDV